MRIAVRTRIGAVSTALMGAWFCAPGATNAAGSDTPPPCDEPYVRVNLDDLLRFYRPNAIP